ncbi:VOC family protein [Niallia sp. Krafla_26]|uniref:VOC family protein n=1 Tax=Niallia sp. Krafla_26 TaxID=3064703 RepID=UPI003D177093
MILGVHPYLVTNGNGREAVKFYEDALDAEVLGVQTFGEYPHEPGSTLPEEAKDLIIHANLRIGNTHLMISDNFPGQPYQIGENVTIAVLMNDSEKTKEVYGKLKEGGEEIMPLQETPWSPLYGQVKDKYGVFWQVSTVVE